jgi:hypothetical protein
MDDGALKLKILRVKLLVVAVETVDVTLGHSAGTSHLETHGALVGCCWLRP